MFYFSFRGTSTVTPFLQNWTLGTSSAGCNIQNMFYDCTQFNGNIAGWTVYTSGSANSGMFGKCNTFQGDGLSTSTFHLTNNCNNFFVQCYALGESTEINLSSWNMNGVTHASEFFRDTTNLGQSGFTADNWDLSNCVNAERMFRSSFTGPSSVTPSLTGWTIGSSTSHAKIPLMFYGCSKFNGNIASWNTSNVTDMNSMFSNATLFNHNIGSWNISKVNNMNGMLNNSGLSTENYSGTLVGWSPQSVQSPVNLGALGRTYNSTGEAARNTLGTKGWTFTGDSFVS